MVSGKQLSEKVVALRVVALRVVALIKDFVADVQCSCKASIRREGAPILSRYRICVAWKATMNHTSALSWK